MVDDKIKTQDDQIASDSELDLSKSQKMAEIVFRQAMKFLKTSNNQEISKNEPLIRDVLSKILYVLLSSPRTREGAFVIAERIVDLLPLLVRPRINPDAKQMKGLLAHCDSIEESLKKIGLVLEEHGDSFCMESHLFGDLSRTADVFKRSLVCKATLDEPRGPKTDANLEDAIRELLGYLDMADCSVTSVSYLPNPEKENSSGIYSGSPVRLVSSLCSALGHPEVTERSARERLTKVRKSGHFKNLWKDLD